MRLSLSLGGHSTFPLDIGISWVYEVHGYMKRYSSSQAAKLIGVTLRTLQNWISDGKVKVPKLSTVGGVKVRLWSKADMDRIHKTRRGG